MFQIITQAKSKVNDINEKTIAQINFQKNFWIAFDYKTDSLAL